MKLSELMAKVPVPSASFEGDVTNDDMCLAIDISEGQKETFGNYVVVQGKVEGVDSSINPKTAESTYIREGQSTTKTGTQRSFKVTGARRIGSAFQDYLFSTDALYAVGEKAIVKYLWFNLLNGVGEKGKVSILVNSDSAGNARDDAGFDVELRKTGEIPEKYVYNALE